MLSALNAKARASASGGRHDGRYHSSTENDNHDTDHDDS
jgi:hypothetical protein